MNIDSFFQPFNLDTLIAILSFLVGLIGLFVGVRANTRIKTINNKILKDTAQDNSQIINGNVTINHSETNDLIPLVNTSIQAAFDQAIEKMEYKYKENLKTIVSQTASIAHEKHLELGNYTKIDWINVYFENAKLVSNSFMQSVWATVLAKELDMPDSISIATLELLKTFNQNDFELFELLAKGRCNNFIIDGGDHIEIGLSWDDCLKLEELRLLSLSGTESTYPIKGHDHFILLASEEYVISMTNQNDSLRNAKCDYYLLTKPAMELINIFSIQPSLDNLKKYVEHLKKRSQEGIDFHIHSLLTHDGKNVTYETKYIY